MTGTKITTTRSVGIKITQSNQNPVVVTSQGTIVTDGNYAIYDATSTRGRVTNHGLLDSKSANGTGVEERAARSLLTNDGIITAGGTGVYMIGARSVVSNTGTITGQATSGDGIVLASGGTITSGSQAMSQAVIAGGNDGILIEAHGGHIANYGSISGRAANGIKIESGGGTITNAGAGSRITGAIYGVVINDNGHVSNAGTITGQSGSGVYIGGVGTVANTSGLISGGSYGVFTGGRNSAVSNFGSIDATTNTGVGIVLSQGGTVQNGSAAAPGGTIHGGLDGVLVRTYGAQIVNYGTITGGDGVGVRLESSTASKETVINGSGASANFLIAGNTYGISLAGDGIVHNDGTISGITGAGIYIAGTGTVSNGDASHTGRAITGGHYGIYIGHTGHVSNFGRIVGNNDSGIGVELRLGGVLENGSAAAGTAAITGGNDGVLVNSGNATITNFGTITGTRLYGVFIKDNGNTSALTNETGALVTGVTGVSFGGSGTLTNAGTMTGTGGTAVVLTGPADTLVVDAGAVFNGTVNGGSTANTLEFASGKGTISAIGTTFTHFGTVTFDAGAKWTLSGSNNGATLIDNGSVKIAANASLAVTTAVSAASTGIFQLASGATLDIAADVGAKNSMSFLAASELVIGNTSLFGTHVGTSTYTGPEIENFAAGDMIDLKNVAAAGAAFTYTAATGLLQITSNGTAVATLFFEQSTLGSGAFHIAADGSGHAVISRH